MDTKNMDIFIVQEIREKKIYDIAAALEKTNVINVHYFEQTLHQLPTPQCCTFDDYIIHFSSAGTVWCGGMRGNGYISKKLVNGDTQSICTISPQLSDYLAKIVEKRHGILNFTSAVCNALKH